MARSDRPGRKGGKDDQVPQRNRQQEQEQEQEQEQQRDRAEEPEHARMQNQLGNQGVIGALAAGQKPGAGGVEGMALRAPETEYELQLGGDDDPADNAPLTIDDLTRSWNRGIKKTDDRAAFHEDMPDDDLPPADQEWLRAVRSEPSLSRRSPSCADRFLQPSAPLLATSLVAWVRALSRVCDPTVAHRVVCHGLSTPPSCLQAPDGRVLLLRARMSSIGTSLALDSAFLRSASIGNVAFADLCLELFGSRPRLLSLVDNTEVEPNTLPRATDIISRLLGTASPEPARPIELGDAPLLTLRRALITLSGLNPAQAFLPAPPTDPVPPEPDPDDPLGLDEILAGHTGGTPDPATPVYELMLATAEKLAAATARSRHRLACMSAIIAETADEWTRGAPIGALLHGSQQLDAATGEVLKLLVEIARAAQGRSVPPRGLFNGLQRAARSLDHARLAAVDHLARAAVGVLPGVPTLGLDLHSVPADALESAWADGRPMDSAAWIRTQPPGVERSVALALTETYGRAEPNDTASTMEAAAQAADMAGRPHLANVARSVAGAASLWTSDEERSLLLADELMASGRARHNGIVFADGALLAMEVHMSSGRPADARAVHLRAGGELYHMAAAGALQLLARWHPPAAIH